MAELKQEEICEEVERLARPAESEAEILNGEKGPDVEGKKIVEEKEKKEEVEKEEVKLPKLSASEFRAYNSMAEHMEYFVGSSFLPPPNVVKLPVYIYTRRETETIVD